MTDYPLFRRDSNLYLQLFSRAVLEAVAPQHIDRSDKIRDLGKKTAMGAFFDLRTSPAQLIETEFLAGSDMLKNRVLLTIL